MKQYLKLPQDLGSNSLPRAVALPLRVLACAMKSGSTEPALKWGPVLLLGLWLTAVPNALIAAANHLSPPATTPSNPAPTLVRSQPGEVTWQNLKTWQQEGSRLTPLQAEAIEAELKRNASDQANWARLLGYYAGQASMTNPLPLARIEARIIEATPLSPLVDPTSKSLFSPLWIDQKSFEIVAQAWTNAVGRNRTNDEIRARAGKFLMREPSPGKFARQGEEFLQKASAVAPQNTARSLQLAEQYLDDARPCFDKPEGSAVAARKALACLESVWPQLEKKGDGQGNLKVRQSLSRAAFWAGDYGQAKKYAQDWLAASAQLDQEPEPATHNERVTRKWARGEAIHDANMILGEIALSEGKTKEAGDFLIAAGKVTDGLTLTSYGPDLALANDLLDAGERHAVLTFFAECQAFWKSGRDSLTQWTKDIEADRKPDFGSGFHFRFKRLRR